MNPTPSRQRPRAGLRPVPLTTLHERTRLPARTRGRVGSGGPVMTSAHRIAATHDVPGARARRYRNVRRTEMATRPGHGEVAAMDPMLLAYAELVSVGCPVDGRQHLVRDRAYASVIGGSEEDSSTFLALCGRRVVAESLAAEPRPLCPECHAEAGPYLASTAVRRAAGSSTRNAGWCGALSGARAEVGVSSGAALAPCASWAGSLGALVERVDDTLYKAKRAGRDTVRTAGFSAVTGC
jgi:hypothetical protein